MKLHYEMAGSGPRVLFISGTGSDLRRFPTPLDGPLPRRFTVLAYDHRGMGRSPLPDEPLSMAVYADDAAALLDEVGWDRCHVVGVSFGGMVAQELALRHPSRVDRLVLACTSSGGAGGSSYPLHELADLPVRERARRLVTISDTRADPSDERLVEAAAERAGWEDRLRHQLAARAEHDTYDRLGGVTAPTLVCAGRYDGLAPLENSTALAAAIPDARLEVFEGGHLFLLQDRRAFEVIADFLA